MLSFVGRQFVGTIIPLNIHNAETATILPTINHNTLSSGLQQYGMLPPCSSSAMKAVSQDLYIDICAVWSQKSSPVHDHSAYACWMSRCVLVPVWLGRCLSSSDWSRFLLRLVSPELGRLGQTPVRCHPHISTFFSPFALIIALQTFIPVKVLLLW